MDDQTAFAAHYPSFGFDLDMMKVEFSPLYLPSYLASNNAVLVSIIP